MSGPTSRCERSDAALVYNGEVYNYRELRRRYMDMRHANQL